MQLGQLASNINNCPQGTLPSNTEVNPKRDVNEHCNAIILRSGKHLQDTWSQDSSKLPVGDEAVVDSHDELKHEEIAQRKSKVLAFLITILLHYILND